MISIICPVYNEESALSASEVYFRQLSRQVELIFVDGGSTDKTVEIAGRYGRVLHSKKGRALQMNCGAGLAKGDILLFLHADSVIRTDSLYNIEQRTAQEALAGGCLSQRIDVSSFAYRLIEAQGNLRARLTKQFYGDQGIFVRRELFIKSGGFPEVPIMEDVLFSRKLRYAGKTAVLSDKIIVSARRWQKRGIIKTSLLYILMIALFRMKVPLEKIKRLYAEIR